MNEDEDKAVYVITDIDKFVDQVRKIVFGCFGEGDDITNDDELHQKVIELSKEDLEELDKTLTQHECLLIVNSHVKPKTTRRGTLKYIIEEDKFNEIIEDINARLVSNLLNILVQKGLIESAYDADENDFIFWVKE